MPFNPIDFSKIAPQGNPFFRDLVENLSTGYQAGQLPQQLERQRQKEELANQLQKYLVEEQPQKFSEESQERQLHNAFQSMLNKEQPQKFGSEMSTASMERAFKQAEINQKNAEAQLPFGGKGLSGEIGQALILNMVKAKYGENSQTYKDAKQRYDLDVAHQQATTDRQTNLINSTPIRLLTAAEKNRVFANAVGLGYTSDEAAKKLAAGATLQDLADAKGKNLADVTPNYPLTAPVITQQQNRNAFINEISTLEKEFAGPMSKVSRKVGGYAPALIWGQISGKMKPEEQAEILAANALQPEFAGLRAKSLQGTQIGVELIDKMQKSVLAKMNVIEGLVSPEVYQLMSQKINNYIEKANGAYNQSLQKQSQFGGQSTTNNATETPKKRVYNGVTNKWEER